jgi:Fe-Mn family superoxide dismutase
MNVTRREALTTLGASALALTASGRNLVAAPGVQASAASGPYSLAPLPYAFDALKAPIDDVLKNLTALPEASRTAIRNNGGGHVNHLQYWTLLGPGAGGSPSGAIADAIQGAFGSFDAFKDQFAKAAMGRFGSGWAWLSDDRGTLLIHSTPNQDTPSMEGRRAIFGLDVWEHAYYLKYQNRRADYVGAFWNVINWAEINKRLKG